MTDFPSYLGVFLLVYGGIHALSSVQRGREWRRAHPDPTTRDLLAANGNAFARTAIAAVALWGGVILVGSPS